MTDYLNNPGEECDHVAVERAIAEFRNARPVLIRGSDYLLLAISVEGLSPQQAAYLEKIAAGTARLVLSATRLRKLGLKTDQAGSFVLAKIDPAYIETLALKTDQTLNETVIGGSAGDDDALELARLSLVLPAALIIPIKQGIQTEYNLLAVDSADLHRYRHFAATRARLVSRAPVPLEGASKTEFVVFRGGEGMRDQVAIVIGEPDFTKPVYVRLHSACLTGDLFGSLKCDCGDQLRNTVKWMAEHQGGILLYLDQEGRGNGIANKMRAYSLQAQGYDTYAADEVLGFDLDQRRFEFAADMLKQLGVRKVTVLTNNPTKIETLRRSGLEIVSDQRVLGRITAENKDYLATKRNKAGHMIDYDNISASDQSEG